MNIIFILDSQLLLIIEQYRIIFKSVSYTGRELFIRNASELAYLWILGVAEVGSLYGF